MSDPSGRLVRKRAAAVATWNPRIATLPFMLMLLLGRLARRVEARAAAKAALQTQRPSP